MTPHYQDLSGEKKAGKSWKQGKGGGYRQVCAQVRVSIPGDIESVLPRMEVHEGPQWVALRYKLHDAGLRLAEGVGPAVVLVIQRLTTSHTTLVPFAARVPSRYLLSCMM